MRRHGSLAVAIVLEITGPRNARDPKLSAPTWLWRYPSATSREPIWWSLHAVLIMVLSKPM